MKNSHVFQMKGLGNKKEEYQERVKDFEGNGFRGQQEPEN